MKTVLITGSSSGYGLETARHFLERGWNVVATMRTPKDDVLPRSERLRVIALDVTKPDSIAATWPLAVVQTCVLHLIRNTFRLASRADWDRMAKDLRPVYTAVNEEQAQAKLAEFHDTWGDRYPAIKGLWDNAWGEFIPFLDYSVEIRRVIYSTNAIESLNARMRRATRARGHFPNEQAALKCLYLTIRSLDPTGRGAHRWMNRWKPALNAFAITFGDRLFPTNN